MQHLRDHYKLPARLVEFIYQTAHSVPKQIVGEERLMNDPEYQNYVKGGIPNIEQTLKVNKKGKTTFKKRIAYQRASPNIFPSALDTTKRGFPQGLS